MPASTACCPAWPGRTSTVTYSDPDIACDYGARLRQRLRRRRPIGDRTTASRGCSSAQLAAVHGGARLRLRRRRRGLLGRGLHQPRRSSTPGPAAAPATCASPIPRTPRPPTPTSPAPAIGGDVWLGGAGHGRRRPATTTTSRSCTSSATPSASSTRTRPGRLRGAAHGLRLARVHGDDLPLLGRRQPTTGYLFEDWGAPQSYMMLDIAALQHALRRGLHHQRRQHHLSLDAAAPGDTLVDGKVGIDPGGNRIFATIWDGGGKDTYDLSAYGTGVASTSGPARTRSSPRPSSPTSAADRTAATPAATSSTRCSTRATRAR